MRRIFLPLSLIANVVLGSFVFFSRTQPDGQAGGEAVVRGPGLGGALSGDLAAFSSMHAYHQFLVDSGVEEQDRALWMHEYLLDRYGDAGMRHRFEGALCESSARILADAKIELFRFNSDVIEEPSYGCLFRPLREHFEELSALKQIELHRLLQAYERELDQIPSQFDSRDLRVDSYKRLMSAASDVLKPEEYREFVVSASPLARAVKRMNLELDAAQHRQLLEILRNDEELSQAILGSGGRVHPASLHNTQIAELLGKEQYVRFMYRVDPLSAGAPVGSLGRALMRGAHEQKEGRSVFGLR